MKFKIRPVHSSQDCGYSSRYIVRVLAFIKHSEKAEQLHEMHTMSESRLSSLAIIHIKYDMSIDMDEVVNLFEGLPPRMMQLQSLLYETK